MKHVAELYEQLVSEGKVNAITRYNLRKFARTFSLAPCGVSFWQLDDLNWDYLRELNEVLGHDRFRIHGGEHFPRTYLNHVMMGQTERTEFIFLARDKHHHLPWRTFFARYFDDASRHFGTNAEIILPPCEISLAPIFKNGLVQDLIHFSDEGERLNAVADFYLALYFMTRLSNTPEATRDSIFEAFKGTYSQYRGDITRILTTTELHERLDDILYLLSKLESE